MKTILRIIPVLLCLALWLCAAATWQAAAAEPELKEEPRKAKPEPPPREQMERKLEVLRAELRDLVAANKMDEARQVKDKISAFESELRAGPLPERRDAQTAEMEEKLRLMAEEIKELRNQGKNDEADRMERERTELKERFLVMRERQAGEPRRFGPPGEQERRRQLVQAAIENLRTAGLPEMAERVEREAKEMGLSPGRRPGDLRPFQERRPEFRPFGEQPVMRGGTETERLERLEADMRDLRQLIRDLQRQLR